MKIKRTIAFTLCCILLCSCCSVSAMADTVATNRRGIVEFVELYIKRLTEENITSGLNMDMKVHSDYGPLFNKDGNSVTLMADFGVIDIDQDDFSVILFETELIVDTDSEKERAGRVMKCAVAISALEYDDVKNDTLGLTSQALGGPANAYDAAMEIMKEITTKVTGGAVQEAITSSKDVPVYSGNYEYSIYYVPSGRENVIWLSAKAR